VGKEVFGGDVRIVPDRRVGARRIEIDGNPLPLAQLSVQETKLPV
jgi:hypothetical protein